jgi:hypothetical protein
MSHPFSQQQQQRPDAAMGDDGDIAFRGCCVQQGADRADDPALGIRGGFPSANADLWMGEECIGCGLEFRLRQIAGRGTVILAQRGKHMRHDGNHVGDDQRALPGFSLRAAPQGAQAGHPGLIQQSAHPFAAER